MLYCGVAVTYAWRPLDCALGQGNGRLGAWSILRWQIWVCRSTPGSDNKALRVQTRIYRGRGIQWAVNVVWGKCFKLATKFTTENPAAVTVLVIPPFFFWQLPPNFPQPNLPPPN